jgi:uncharacterized protein YecT (DUF1311 family)
MSMQFAFGQDQEIIDKDLKACLDSSKNQTTAGMVECVDRAYNSWDKELNKYYSLLMKSSLTKDEKIKLQKAQVKWLEYVKNEKDFSTTLYTNFQGTMWIPISINRSMEIIRERALALKTYYNELPYSK